MILTKKSLTLRSKYSEKCMNSQIKRIVLTGGPCAGKTTALASISKHFSKLGYRVLYVPEIPTMITALGWNYMTDNRAFYYEGEKIILEMQLELEDKVWRLAETLAEPVIIVCDRGPMDISAYISHEMWEELMASCSTTQEEILKRYDGVIHLASAAHGAESFYTLTTNENRYEKADAAGLALACELDQKVYDAWSIHPVMSSIPSFEDFEVKMKRVIDEIEKIIL